MNIGIEKQKKIRNVNYHNDNCIFYEKNDSQARCNLEKILVPRFRDVNQHINECARNDMNVTRLCIIPQIYDIYDFMEANFSLPQCQTEDEYICSIIGMYVLHEYFCACLKTSWNYGDKYAKYYRGHS